MPWRNDRDNALEAAYPGITFRPHTRGWLARFMRAPAECVHLETDQTWMAALLPDTAWLLSKPQPQRVPQRPEASLCRACLCGFVEPELAQYPGRVIFFEPDPQAVTQYFFVSAKHFEDAYLQPQLVRVLRSRLARGAHESCEHEGCSKAAKWLWFSRQEVQSLDESARVEAASGKRLCPRHGTAQLSKCFQAIPQANLEYFNLPYGDSGAYVWF